MALTPDKILQRRTRKLLQKPVLQLDHLEDRSTPAVTGIVFQDYNANGVFDTGGTIANNGTGTLPTANDHGLAGITVTAYDSTNTVVGTAISGSNGSYTLTPSKNGQLRIEFTGLPTGVFFGPSGLSNNSAVQFVDANAANVNLALVRPEDYSVANPTLVTSVYVFGGSTANDENPNTGVILSTASSAGSADGDTNLTNYINPTTHDLAVHQDQVGTTWGLAYDATSGKLYASAFLKRHSGLGPGGAGAIYQTGLTGTTASVYADLNSIYGDFPAGNMNDVFRDAANNPVAFNRNYTDVESWARDGLVRFTDVNGVTRDLGWDAVGKISLGGLTNNADNTKLYTIALGDRRLYSLPTSGALNTSTVQRFDIPIPATVTGRTAANPLGDLRPFAVEYYRGLIYVGAVNSAESTQNRNDLKAYVFAFDPVKGTFVNAARQSTTTEAVLTVDLNYDRGHTHMGGEQDNHYASGIAPPDPAEWNPWSPTIKTVPNQPEAIGRADYPQPWLTGLSFDTSGNIVLGIRDRAGDQFGRLTAEDPMNPNAFNFFGITAGDTLRAFINTPGNLDAVQANPAQTFSGWTLEMNGRSPAGVGGAPQNTGQGPGGGEFYYQDDLPRDPTQPPVGVATEHDEVSAGGVLQIPGTNTLISTAFDPVRQAGVVNTGGFRWYDNTTGATIKQYQIYSTPISPGAQTFGKANGVGDLIAIGGQAPVEIGNYVWNDTNRNGIQDAGEAAVSGLQLNLYAAGNDGQFGTADDVLLGSATTDANGNYYFSSVAGTTTSSRVMNLPLAPSTQYQVRVPGGQAALARKEATVANAGTNGSIDSNAVSTAAGLVVNVTTGVAGQADHTFDIGIVDQPLVSIGNFVWNDANNNGVFDNGEAGIGNVTVNLYAADGTTLLATQQTTATGGYQFDSLRAGSYIVEIIPPANFASSSGKNGSLTGPFEPGVVGNLNNQDHGTAQANGRIRAAVVALANPGDLANPDSNGQGANNANFNVDFGLYRLQSVGNFVWIDGNNNGRFDAGESPVVNAPVDLLDAAGNVLASTTTDANGNYLFTRLGTGTYSVRVLAPTGYRSSTGQNGSLTGPYEPGVTGIQDNEDHGTTNGAFVQTAPFILNAPGANPDDGGFANLRQDFGLFQPVSVGNFVWEDANNNGVLDAGESPLAGVPVTLFDGSGAQLATTTTDANGNYLFTNLAGGQYIIRVTAPAGYVSSTGVPTNATSGPFEPAPQTNVDNSDHGTSIGGNFVQSVVTLGGPGSSDNPDNSGLANLRQDFGLFRPLSIGDFVWKDTNNNGKFDSGETGVPNVVVKLLDATGAIVATTTTSATGNYLFTGLATGTYSVQIETPAGFASSTGPNSVYEPAPQTNNNNEDHGTAAGAIIQAPPIVLGVPGTNPDNGGLANLRQDFGLFPLLSIGNQVWYDVNNNGKLDAGETGIANIPVRLLNASLSVIASTTTDANGNYLFTNLLPGTYSVEIDRPADKTSSTGTPNSFTGPYEVAPGGVLPDNANDSEDKGNTLAGGTVIRAKPVTLLAFGDNPDVGGTGNIRQDFGLTDNIVPPPPPPPIIPPANVSGYVYRDTFQPNGIRQPANGESGISGVTITIKDANGNTVGTTKTDANGYYQFLSLPAGAYTIYETQPPAFIDGLDTPGSLGGTSPSNDVLTVTLAPNDFGLEYNFGEVLPTPPIVVPPSPPPPVSPPPGEPSKTDFLGSSPNQVVTVPPTSPPPIISGPTAPSFSNPLNTANPRFIITAGGAGSLPTVRVFDYSAGVERYNFSVYENSFTGGVRVAQGDVDGDGVDDIITGTGIGGGPRIKVYSGATGALIRDFFAFEPTFRGGIFVAAGDIDGDGKADIVVGAEVGGGPRITTFSGADGSVLNNFFAFDPNQRGGTRIALGDFNGDGKADIVASTGAGVPTRIRVFDGTNVGNILTDFVPFESTFTGGVNLAVGDFDGDGKPDIIAGAEAGGGPRVMVFNGQSLAVMASYFAFDTSFTGGTRVAAQDVNGDGRSDIVVGSGAGRQAETIVFNANGLGVIDDFFPIDTTGGIYVG
ncbi:SdrD B-like domain-containing protein [Limnoglobus roseus]|uniref:Tandem repeat protein n=1 Tax=Limnoglobus roseus TaxID=2598579 RepID=A0A5C1A686_9BACT|nr:SdrD B-like domain-containing protein [Limnoglobus roseus]QEL13843.1 tandem repeat protein [Limnoglobus roseus]